MERQLDEAMIALIEEQRASAHQRAEEIAN
jgi:hypothetical protein